MRTYVLVVAVLTLAACDDKKPAAHQAQAVEVKAPPKVEAPAVVVDAGAAEVADAGEAVAAPAAAEPAAVDAGT